MHDLSAHSPGLFLASIQDAGARLCEPKQRGGRSTSVNAKRYARRGCCEPQTCAPLLTASPRCAVEDSCDSRAREILESEILFILSLLARIFHTPIKRAPP